MIQDIAPHTYHNEYKPVAPDENSIILVYENGKSFFRKEDSSDVITLPKAKRNGYTFDGWYTAKTKGTKVSVNTKVTRNLNLYAHWTKVKEFFPQRGQL